MSGNVCHFCWSALNKSIKLLMKGSDSSVLNIIDRCGNMNSRSEAGEVQSCSKILSATLEHLDNYAREGLRTLVVASKDLSQKEVLHTTSWQLFSSCSRCSEYGFRQVELDNLISSERFFKY